MLTHKSIGISALILTFTACGSPEDETTTATTNTTTGTTTTTTPTETGQAETGMTETGMTETGTTTTTTTTTGTPLTLDDGVQDIFNANCTSYCHSGGSASASMDLSTGNSHSNIVGVVANQSSLNRVTAGDADGSYMVYKLAGTHENSPANGSGVSMPKSSDPLSSADQALIIDWINEGANP